MCWLLTNAYLLLHLPNVHISNYLVNICSDIEQTSQMYYGQVKPCHLRSCFSTTSNPSSHKLPPSVNGRSIFPVPQAETGQHCSLLCTSMSQKILSFLPSKSICILFVSYPICCGPGPNPPVS